MSSIDRELNLKFIKRGRLKQGDIFALLIDNSYLFGRVVNDKVSMMGSCLPLIYVYNIQSSKPKVDCKELTPDKLLLPPLITFPSLWTKGYAKKVSFELIQDHNALSHHCFKVNEKKYVDEFGTVIEKINDQYCGIWRIISLGIIDDMISDAIGVKRTPLQNKDIWYISGRGEKIWNKQPISELKKHLNYEEIIKEYPEIIER